MVILKCGEIELRHVAFALKAAQKSEDNYCIIGHINDTMVSIIISSGALAADAIVNVSNRIPTTSLN